MNESLLWTVLFSPLVSVLLILGLAMPRPQLAGILSVAGIAVSFAASLILFFFYKANEKRVFQVF